MDRDEISNLYRGPSIDASYQVSVHLAEGFQRRRLKCEKLTDDRSQVMAKAHITTLTEQIQNLEKQQISHCRNSSKIHRKILEWGKIAIPKHM